jgi:hypothetical protein
MLRIPLIFENMNKLLILFLIMLFPFLVNGQYDQKVSITSDIGTFKTFGTKYTESTGPLQFPNYKMGFSGNIGAQFRLGEHFSLAAGFGVMISNMWNYSPQDTDNRNYWSIEDTTTGNILAEGENYLDLHNYALYVKPKFYLLPDKKWEVYFSAGINVNWTRCLYENNYWYAMEDLGLLGPDDTEPWNDNLEESFGIGFNPGVGVEYNTGKMINFYVEAGYYFIALDETKFKDPSRVENFNAVVFNAGIRLFFIKSKDL